MQESVHRSRTEHGGYEMDAYSMIYEVRWTDIDANRHVRYSAYIDAAAEQRYHFFSEHNLTPDAFDKLNVGRFTRTWW